MVGRLRLAAHVEEGSEEASLGGALDGLNSVEVS